MKKILLFSFCIGKLYAVRNPFLPSVHSYYYTGYGLVHATYNALGILWIDGNGYCVRVKDYVAGHAVIALSADQIIVSDERGYEWTIAKNPPT